MPSILTQHIQYSKAVEDVYPISSTYRFSILREPASHFLSLFNYLHIVNPSFRSAETPEKFVTERLNLLHKGMPFPASPAPNAKRFNRNSNWKTFGLHDSPDFRENQMLVTEALQKIEQNFHLIMITEYMEESLILLQDGLGLELEDLTSFVKNVASYKTETSQDLVEKIREWQDLDLKLYRHFNETLWRKIEEFGRDRMEKRIEELRSMNHRLTSECVESHSATENEVPVQFRDWTPKGVTFKAIKLFKNASDIWYVCNYN